MTKKRSAKVDNNTDDLTSQYRNPLTVRYASKAMSSLFSEKHRALLWRDLWILLAEEEKSLGLPIQPAQIEAMKRHRDDLRLDRVRYFEEKLKHDVMSHVKAFGEVAPSAEPIIHLGATSCYVTDNSDLLIMKQASELLGSKLVSLLKGLSGKMAAWKSKVVTGFTHFQPAQPVTMGKRISLWAQDLLWDLEELDLQISRLRPLGCKGATGTQASFLILFDGDEKKVRALDAAIAKRLGFTESVPLSGQTLSRKMDVWMLQVIAGMASSLSKMSYDLRLLQHLGELREAFGKDQIGSSAMPYKKNPILAERMTSLARFAINLVPNAYFTHGTQWLERSLDDSANRRIVIAEAFLTADALLETALRMVDGMVLDEKAIRKRLDEYSGFFKTEEDLMRGTLKGGSRQKLHEKLRKEMLQGKLKKKESVDHLCGLAASQTERFLKEYLKPQIQNYEKKFGSIKASRDLAV